MQVRWLSFHSGYDFGYMLRMLTDMNLPEEEEDFFEILRIYFPSIYDVKYLMKSCKSLKGGLQEVADQLELERIGGSAVSVRCPGSVVSKSLSLILFTSACLSSWNQGPNIKPAVIPYSLALPFSACANYFSKTISTTRNTAANYTASDLPTYKMAPILPTPTPANTTMTTPAMATPITTALVAPTHRHRPRQPAARGLPLGRRRP